tara:strand:+ start:40 stop:1062 length:1023 start_codon:yes stop_codon:yes gene_type:complete
MKILITGAAGFIGFHLCKKLLKDGYQIIGLDNINSYYDINLKLGRLKQLNKADIKSKSNFTFKKVDLVKKEDIFQIFDEVKPDVIFHLAAQAGVRYSIENPFSYIDSNIIGFMNIIECCRKYKVKNFIFASSSSVYGGNTKIPYSEKDPVDHPISLYAATKRSNELFAHVYSHLYDIPSIGIRLFTVYGPWGRPDMAPFIFTKSIFAGEKIKIFNNGDMNRDFTYIDDVIDTLVKLVDKAPLKNKKYDSNKSDPSKSWSNFQIFNIGNSNPIQLMEFIEILEKEIGIKAIKEYLPMQPGDVKTTFAETKNIEDYIETTNKTSLEKGIKNFINWYKEYYSE